MTAFNPLKEIYLNIMLIQRDQVLRHANELILFSFSYCQSSLSGPLESSEYISSLSLQMGVDWKLERLLGHNARRKGARSPGGICAQASHLHRSPTFTSLRWYHPWGHHSLQGSPDAATASLTDLWMAQQVGAAHRVCILMVLPGMLAHQGPRRPQLRHLAPDKAKPWTFRLPQKNLFQDLQKPNEQQMIDKLGRIPKQAIWVLLCKLYPKDRLKSKQSKRNVLQGWGISGKNPGLAFG